MGTGFSSGVIKNVLELDKVAVAKHYEETKFHFSVHFKMVILYHVIFTSS